MKRKIDPAKLFAGKGYYIALILCAAAIGVTGYLYYRNIDNGDGPAEPDGGDISVISPSVDIDNAGLRPTSPAPSNATLPPAAPQPLRTASPLEGQTVMAYCMDCLGYNPTTRDWRTHDGLDIGAQAGTAVCAAASGTVYTVYEDASMGMTVVIRHDDGYVTTYASLDKNVTVSVGEEVTLGQTLGYVGETALLETALGTHLHFSVTHNGQTIDPAGFLALS